MQAIAAAKVKTDKVDSNILALLLRADLIPAAHMIAPAHRAPRDLMRTRLRLVAKSVSAQNSIDRLLEKLMEVCLATETEEAATNYAALHYLRGTVDGAIHRWDADWKATKSKKAGAPPAAIIATRGGQV